MLPFLIKDKQFFILSFSSRGSLDIYHTFHLAHFFYQAGEFLPAFCVKGNLYGGDSLFASGGMDTVNVNRSLGKNSGDIHQKPGTVISIYFNPCQIKAVASLQYSLLPLCVN